MYGILQYVQASHFYMASQYDKKSEDQISSDITSYIKTLHDYISLIISSDITSYISFLQ